MRLARPSLPRIPKLDDEDREVVGIILARSFAVILGILALAATLGAAFRIFVTLAGLH